MYVIKYAELFIHLYSFMWANDVAGYSLEKQAIDQLNFLT